MSKMNPVVHFEMPYEDKDRIADFYTKAFGWKMNKFGEDMCNYITAHTTETYENNIYLMMFIYGKLSDSCENL